MIWVLLFLFVTYFLALAVISFGFKKMEHFIAKNNIPQTRFSLLIPFRNEAENLPALFQSIEKLIYPEHLLEVIFINDASDDASPALVDSFRESCKFSIKTLQNERVSNSPKKDALSKGIEAALGEWIVTTDADCELPENWLLTTDAFIQKTNPAMVCGAVLYASNNSFLENFQQMDGLSLQGVSIGAFGLGRPLLCNGANLAYRKDVFLKVGGFSGNDHLASGDDIFLMEKIKKQFPGRVKFLKSPQTIVITNPEKSWSHAVNQRIRWASKTSKQKNLVSLLLGILVVLVNVGFLMLPLLLIIDFEAIEMYAVLLILKMVVDYLAVRQAATFFGIRVSFWNFIKQNIVYSFLILRIAAGSLRGRYQWKGRSFQNQ